MALPLKMVKQILNIEFVKMAELLLDTSEQGHPHCRTCHPPVTNILQWLECLGRLASVLWTKYLDKAAEFWAHQSSILRAARNVEGTAWVAYDRQYWREALARWDVNWSVCNARLYSEVFTGKPRPSHAASIASAKVKAACCAQPVPIC